MMANNQHEDLVKFVSEAWSTIVDNSRGGAIFYKCNVPEQQPPTAAAQSRNYNMSTANSNSTASTTNSSSSTKNLPFRQQ